MKYSFLIFLILSSSVFSKSNIKVLTYNTMCDFCKGSDYFSYDKRLKKIRDNITNQAADLIAIQELRSGDYVDYINTALPEFKSIYTNSFLMSYADPAILYNSKKFTLLEKGQLWLGPNPNSFNTGWKLALPRQLLWAKLKYQDFVFIFMTSHFDNRLENIAGSIELVSKFSLEHKVPIIFAADTNTTIEMKEYKLFKENFINTFDLKKSFQIVGEYSNDRELCYLKKGKHFPECRVDHIFISKNSPFEVDQFSVILKRFNKKFASDHRPVTVTLKVKN